MKSCFQQYVHHPDGTITLEGIPNYQVDAIQDQGHATARDIEQELGLPKYFEEWEILAQPRGLSGRQIQFIVVDEYTTRFPGHYRFQPQRITLPQTCHLEFGHRGFVVGIVHTFLLGFEELREQTKRETPHMGEEAWKSFEAQVQQEETQEPVGV